MYSEAKREEGPGMHDALRTHNILLLKMKGTSILLLQKRKKFRGGSKWGSVLRLMVNILAFLRLTVNFFPLRLTDLLKINFHCLKKLKMIFFYCCKASETFWGGKMWRYTTTVNYIWSISSFLQVYCGTLTNTKQIKQESIFNRIC